MERRVLIVVILLLATATLYATARLARYSLLLQSPGWVLDRWRGELCAANPATYFTSQQVTYDRLRDGGMEPADAYRRSLPVFLCARIH